MRFQAVLWRNWQEIIRQCSCLWRTKENLDSSTLTLNVGSQYAGEYGNLFYYDSDGKMVYIDAGLVTPEGTCRWRSVTLRIMLLSSTKNRCLKVMCRMICSHYQAVEQVMQRRRANAARTGDTAPVGILIVLMLAALASVSVVVLKRRNSEK